MTSISCLETHAAAFCFRNIQSVNIPIIGFDSGVPKAPKCAVYANASTETMPQLGSNQVAASANETLQVCGKGDDKIIAVGFDPGKVLKAAVKSGVMYGAVTQAPVSIGSILIELLAKAAAGEKVENTDTGR